jgi:hypothetical protein
MTYYQANTDNEDIICDTCGETRWDIHPKYGSNVDARLEEAKVTGIRWSWTPVYSSDFHPCSICEGATK